MMRVGPDDKFWVVVDPSPESVIEDVLFRASPWDLERQFRGGLTMASNPTIFTKEDEARTEAQRRLRA